MKRTTPAQQRMLNRLYRHGPERSPVGSGTIASAWHRTAESLHRKGLIRLTRSGDGWVASWPDDVDEGNGGIHHEDSRRRAHHRGRRADLLREGGVMNSRPRPRLAFTIETVRTSKGYTVFVRDAETGHSRNRLYIGGSRDRAYAARELAASVFCTAGYHAETIFGSEVDTVEIWEGMPS